MHLSQDASVCSVAPRELGPHLHLSPFQDQCTGVGSLLHILQLGQLFYQEHLIFALLPRRKNKSDARKMHAGAGCRRHGSKGGSHKSDGDVHPLCFLQMREKEYSRGKPMSSGILHFHRFPQGTSPSQWAGVASLLA